MMTNKEFQDILACYPDDYSIQMDDSFGWEVPSSAHKVDPHLYVNTDFGFIEIEAPECRDIWTRDLPKSECLCVCKMKGMSDPVICRYSPEQGGFVMTHGGMAFVCDTKMTMAWFEIPAYED